MPAPVLPGVGVEQPHVVQQLVRHDPHRVRVRGVEAGQDPHPARQPRQRTRPDVGVRAVEGAAVAATAALAPDVDVVGVEAAGHELDAGVGLDLVHGLGDGEPVILVEVVTQHVRNLDILQ